MEDFQLDPKKVYLSPTLLNCQLQASCSTRKSISLKFVDDLSIAVQIDTKKDVTEDPIMRPQPYNRHELTQHILPDTNNLLQAFLDDLSDFTANNNLAINEKKTTVLIFNVQRKVDYPPELTIGNSDILKVVEETKLLGIILSSNLKWQSNTDHICAKATSKLWMLRRMKRLHVDPMVMVDSYKKEIRCHLELGVACWHSGLTLNQAESIERIQKIAVSIILDEKLDYYLACCILQLEPLSSRRDDICLRFAQRTAFKSRHSDLFKPVLHSHQTREQKNNFLELKSNQTRMFNSPLPYLTRRLNGKFK